MEEDQIIEDEIVENEAIEDEIVEEQEPIENSSEGDGVSGPEINQDDEEDDEEDRIVTIGDESETDPEGEGSEVDIQEAPAWVKKTRKVNRKQAAEIKALKKQLEQATAPKEPEIELGAKPTLASCKFDDKKFETELLEWNDRKRKVEEQKAKKMKLVEEQNNAYRAKQERYAAKKQEHAFKDFNEAESLVSTTLSLDQQGIIVDGADDSALLVYALGKNPKELERLSKLNPIEFAVQLGKLETKLSVKNRKAPAPEKRVTGAKSGGVAQSDAHMEKLEKEAEKTGDRTAIRLYRKKLREKGRLNG